ncbi:zinc ribbon domain-containing protein [bacterium]|nr:zinc ribbon domain-containing protein [bacterium]
MPIYEFICSKCNAEFDKLTSFDWKSAGVSCPKCGSAELTRVVSRVGVKSGGKMLSSDSEACTSCSSGTCSTCH